MFWLTRKLKILLLSSIICLTISSQYLRSTELSKQNVLLDYENIKNENNINKHILNNFDNVRSINETYFKTFESGRLNSRKISLLNFKHTLSTNSSSHAINKHTHDVPVQNYSFQNNTTYDTTPQNRK